MPRVRWRDVLGGPALVALAACPGRVEGQASEAVSRPPFPIVPRVGGSGVLASPRVVTITTPGDPAARDIATFDAGLASSEWFRAWGPEYGVGPPRAGRALSGGALPAMPAGGYSEATMDDYVRDAVASAADPPSPDGGSIYVLFLPPGAFYARDGACSYDGYHTTYGAAGDGVAFVQRCGKATFGDTDLDDATALATHEIAEAATHTGSEGWVLAAPSDRPWTGDIWATADGALEAEIGDLCGLQTRLLAGGYVYQRMYSDDAARAGGDPCVPPSPAPYYNVSTPRGWTAAAPGTTARIPVTGWATGPTGDWYVSAQTRLASRPDPGFSFVLTGPAAAFGDAGRYHVTNDGETQTLEVSVPPGAPSGSYVSVLLLSAKRTSSGSYPPGEDFGHRWLVGVYVP